MTRAMPHKFSTYLLDKVIAISQEKREQQRAERLAALLTALEQLSKLIPFEEAYVFGSLTKPYRFSPNSDIDIGFIGLRDVDFFPAMAFLSRELGRDVDFLQLEGHRLKEKVISEGIRWKRKD